MSQIVINDILPRTQLTAVLNQTEFNTNWTANVASDVVVYVTPFGVAPDDLTQMLSYPSQYSVAFIGAQLEVQVTLVTPSAAGDTVTIIRQTPADRLNLYSNINFTPSMLNNDFGILTLVDQQAQMVDQDVGPRYNYSAAINTDNMFPTRDTILPTLSANQFWAMNDAGTAIEAVEVSDIGGGITEIDTGTGLTGGPITSSGTISFAPIAANSFWANITGSLGVPTEVSTSYFLKSASNLGDLPDPAQARINLGLVIGTNVQAYSPALTSIAALPTVANQLIYTTATNTYSLIGPNASSVLVTDGSSVPSLGPILPLAVQSNITQLGPQAIALNMNNHKINNVTDPSSTQDAATKAYVDSQFGDFLPKSGGTMTGAINMGNFQINGLANPTGSQDAVNLSYLNTQLALKLSLSGGTMTGNIIMGSHYITNLLDPVNPQDAATKNYVDTVAIGLTVQAACYAATTTNLTALYVNGASGIGATLTNSGALATFTLDGTTPPTNSRILVKDQSSTFQNGIYVLTNVGSGAVAWILTRATDYDQPSEIQPGDLVVINNGTVNGGASFIETASISVIGTDPILFSQFTFSATAVLLKALNLSDVANTTIAFNNISPLTTKGDLIAYSTQNVRLGVGASNGQILQVDSSAATGLAWSTATYPVTTTVNQILYSSATNTVVGLATTVGGILVTDGSGVPVMLANPTATGKMLQSVNGLSPAWSTALYPVGSGAAGKVLISDGTNIVYSTPTYPNISSTARKMIVSDGTNYVPSTETWGVPGSSGQVLTSDGTNWVSQAPSASGTVNAGLINQLAYYAANGTTLSGLATANNSVLVTNGSGVPSLGTTLPSGLTIPGFAASGANTDITSLTGITGKIQAPTAIASTTSANVLGFTYAASAVNYLQLSNAAAAGNPTVFAIGTDTNIGFDIVSKGTGRIGLFSNGGSTFLATFTAAASPVNYFNFSASATTSPISVNAVGTDSNIAIQLDSKGTKGINLKGYTDASSASAGYTGEYLSSVIASGSAVAITTNVSKTIASISLTAGDWDVWGEIIISGASSTTITTAGGSISPTDNGTPTVPSDSASRTFLLTTTGTSWTPGGSGVPVIPIGACRVNVSTTTPYYLVAFANFGTSTANAFGKICARRRR